MAQIAKALESLNTDVAIITSTCLNYPSPTRRGIYSIKATQTVSHHTGGGNTIQGIQGLAP